MLTFLGHNYNFHSNLVFSILFYIKFALFSRTFTKKTKSFENSCLKLLRPKIVLVGILSGTVPISSEDAGVEDLLPKCKSSDSLIAVEETNNIYMTFITSILIFCTLD